MGIDARRAEEVEPDPLADDVRSLPLGGVERFLLKVGLS